MVNLKNGYHIKFFTLVLAVVLLIIYFNEFIPKNILVSSQNHVTFYNQTKYIQYVCDRFCGGWSDRLDGIMSALALAFIQNRSFLINITHPCQMNNLLAPNIIKWDKDISELTKLKVYDLNAMGNLTVQAEMKTLDLRSYLNKFDLIRIRNNLDWLTSFSENNNSKHIIESLGYERSKFKARFLLKKWYDLLFKLKPSLNERYLEFLKLAKPNNKAKLICAQIRIGGTNRKNHASDMKFNDKNVSKIIWNFIRNNITSSFKSDDDYKIYVTTDDEDIQAEALEEFGANKTVINSGEIVHIDRDVHNLNDCSQIEKTILDFHCLQKCDIAVVSSSGFGVYGLMNRENPLENLYILKSEKILSFK